MQWSVCVALQLFERDFGWPGLVGDSPKSSKIKMNVILLNYCTQQGNITIQDRGLKPRMSIAFQP